MKEKFYIWSLEHNAWWKPNSCGYCHDISSAGIYSFAEATAIVKSANCCGKINETMFSVNAINQLLLTLNKNPQMDLSI